MKRLALTIGVCILGLVVGAGLVLSQGVGTDPWWRPLNPNGQSAGITYGNTLPTTNLVPGEIAVDVNAGNIAYIRRAASWDAFLGIAGGGTGTNQTIPVFDTTGVNLADSTITDDGTDVIATGGLITSGTAVGAANSILIDGNNSNIIFETTATANELHLAAATSTGDSVVTFGDYDVQGAGAAVNVLVSLGAVGIQQANGVWGNNSSIQFEGTTVNNFETTIIARDPSADVSFTLSDYGAGGAGPDFYPIVSTADVCEPEVAGSIWANADGITYEGATADAFEFIVEGNEFLGGADVTLTANLPATNTDGEILQLATTVPDVTAGNAVTGFSVAITNAVHTGGELMGISLENIVGAAAAVEYAIEVGTGWDIGLYMAESMPIAIAAGGVFTVESVSDIGSWSFAARNFPDAVGHYAEAYMVGIGDGSAIADMDGNDAYSLLLIDITNGNHAGANNLLYGMYINPIVADAQATEYAMYIDDGWDEGLYFGDPGEIAIEEGGLLTIHSPGNAVTWAMETLATRANNILVGGYVNDIDHGITAQYLINPTLAANDNANDQRNVILIDVEVPNGSGGLVNGINIDAITDDINTIDSAIFVEGGWDSAITITETGHAPTSSPLAGSVYIFLDDSVDYSGAGGVDCWLVLRDTNGVNYQIVQVVLNGVCP